MFGVQMIDESEQERKQICSAIGERMRRARKENDIPSTFSLKGQVFPRVICPR